MKAWLICGVVMTCGVVWADQVNKLPEVNVTAEQLEEERPVGPNQQPDWTTQRRFPTTRVYVQQPPWGVGFEQWWRGKFPRKGDSSHLFQEELSVGLPYRLQLDIYENWEINEQGTVRHAGIQPEVRWALAEWGKIPLNPTIYGEWKFNDEAPDGYEIKILFGEELAPRWHWGFNAIYEQEVGGERETEWAWSQAISYTLIDQKLSAGVEMKFAYVTAKGSRATPEIEFLMGPSLQWRPTPNTHLDIVPQIGRAHV